MPGSILRETMEAIADILGPELDAITIERAVIGFFFTGVKLSTGEAGTCATPRDAVPGEVCCPLSGSAVPFAGRLRGASAAEMVQGAMSGDGFRRAVGIATLNALAERSWKKQPHPGTVLHPACDAFAITAPRPGEQVVLVGAFIPFLKELKRRGTQYLVLEQNPATLKAEEMPFYRPAERAPEVVPQADVLLITGATLLNDTLEDLLALARPETRVIVVGPTVGMLPDAFFARGADILGSVRITEPDAFLELLAQGGSAPHFLGRHAEKIVLARSAPAAHTKAA